MARHLHFMRQWMHMDAQDPTRKIQSRLWLRVQKGAAAFFLLCFSSLISFGLLEFAVRKISPPPPFGPYFDLRPYKKLELRPNLPGISSVVQHTANKWGMRGEDPPVNWDSTFTLITIGGSTTQCFYLDDHKAWPQMVQEGLRQRNRPIWVGNAGLDGHSTRGHVLLMEKVLDQIRPKSVLFLVGVNDLALSIAYGEQGSPFDNRWIEKTRFKGLRAFLEKSRIVQIIAIWKRVKVDGALVVSQVGHQRYHPIPLVGKADTLPSANDSASLHKYLPSLSPFLKNLDSLVNLARKREIRPIFMTQPGLFSEEAQWDSIAGGMSFLETSRYKISARTEARALRIFNEALLNRCQELRVECLDLAAQIPHDSAYFYDDYHFTELGSATVASAVTTFLQNLPNYYLSGK